ncbi:hypothetical protein C6P77_02380 [Burkholderia ambifaria]|nr:hypothetical protein C6P77_02380 [Burkholderia ambifaria]
MVRLSLGNAARHGVGPRPGSRYPPVGRGRFARISPRGRAPPCGSELGRARVRDRDRRCDAAVAVACDYLIHCFVEAVRRHDPAKLPWR